MKKIAMISLGCAKNLVDSENILGLLVKNNYQIVNNKDEADILIINTCGFIEASKQESIENILDVINLGKKIVVAVLKRRCRQKYNRIRVSTEQLNTLIRPCIGITNGMGLVNDNKVKMRQRIQFRQPQ